MAKKTTRQSRSRKEKPAPMADAAREREVTRLMHTEFLPGIVYEKALAPLLGDGLQSRASDHARDTISRMAPRDPVEEMMVAQLLFTHARVIRLSELANQQSSLDAIRVMNELPTERATPTGGWRWRWPSTDDHPAPPGPAIRSPW